MPPLTPDCGVAWVCLPFFPTADQGLRTTTCFHTWAFLQFVHSLPANCNHQRQPSLWSHLHIQKHFLSRSLALSLYWSSTTLSETKTIRKALSQLFFLLLTCPIFISFALVVICSESSVRHLLMRDIAYSPVWWCGFWPASCSRPSLEPSHHHCHRFTHPMDGL